VRYRGIGLEPEELENIFDPFYRSSRVHTVSSGVGIGLTVCKRLVEAMGGRIWAVPRSGGGSEFGFTLPTP
jgi:signal transduction histidine kinase